MSKKKIKDLTLGEVEKMCHSRKTCCDNMQECPLNKSDICTRTFDEFTKNVLEEEIEVEDAD